MKNNGVAICPLCGASVHVYNDQRYDQLWEEMFSGNPPVGADFDPGLRQFKQPDPEYAPRMRVVYAEHVCDENRALYVENYKNLRIARINELKLSNDEPNSWRKKHKINLLNRAIDHVEWFRPCPECSAEIGEPCNDRRSKNKRPLIGIHEGRHAFQMRHVNQCPEFEDIAPVDGFEKSLDKVIKNISNCIESHDPEHENIDEFLSKVLHEIN